MTIAKVTIYFLLTVLSVNVEYIVKSSLVTKLDDLFYVVTFAFYMFMLPRLKVNTVLISLVLLFIVGFYSSLLSDISVINLSSIYYYLALILAYTSSIFYFRSVNIDKAFKVLWGLLIINICIILVEMTAYYLANVNLLGALMHGSFIRPSGLLKNAAYSSWLVALAAVYFLARYFEGRRTIYLLAYLLLFLLVLLMQSRKPVIDIAVGSLLVYFASRKLERLRGIKISLPRKLATAFIFVGVSVGVALVGFKQFERLKVEYMDNYSTAMRSLMYLYATNNAIQSFPLGTGFGTFGSYLSIVNDSPLYAEYGLNDTWGFGGMTDEGYQGFLLDAYYPLLISEYGFVGFLIFMFLFYKLTKGAIQIYGTSRITYLILPAFGSIFVEALGSDVLNTAEQKNIILFLIVMYVLCRRRINESQKKGGSDGGVQRNG